VKPSSSLYEKLPLVTPAPTLASGERSPWHYAARTLPKIAETDILNCDKNHNTSKLASHFYLPVKEGASVAVYQNHRRNIHQPDRE
jgi:hypothetical protein